MGRSGGEYGCTHGDGVGESDTITANNIHGNLKEIKLASQIPEETAEKVKTKARPRSSQKRKSLVHTRNKKITW